MWAIILIVIVVLLAIWWFMTHNEKPAEPAKTGLLSAPVEFALSALPAPAADLMHD
jgi:amino acid transporter